MEKIFGDESFRVGVKEMGEQHLVQIKTDE